MYYNIYFYQNLYLYQNIICLLIIFFLFLFCIDAQQLFFINV